MDHVAISDDANMLDGMISAAKAAFLLDVTLRTLSNWEKAGILKPVRRRKRRYFRISDVMALRDPDAL